MNNLMRKSQIGIIIALGAVWGLSEAVLGMGLRSCASFVSGSLMTGVALFFIAGSWMVSRHILGVSLLIIVTSLFKLFDALLLSLPLRHGAVANPIFAFIMEGAAFLVMIMIINEKLRGRTGGRAILGGMAALLAVNLFPLVKYATGIPACVFPGTGYPLSLYYAPIAVSLSFITVPLGVKFGEVIENFEWNLKYLAIPVAPILCLALIALLRLA